MVLSDFLSRQQGDDSDPHQIIPISFNMKEILKQNYQNIVKTPLWYGLDHKLNLKV